ncbi:alpha/beta hydrolase [Vibrio parahaemolyticus]|nr:alpha/beta hydrolase [Vibrio parahaemolyticus]
MYKSIFFLGLSTIIFSNAVHAYTLEKDLSYGKGARNQLDLYLPDNLENPPLVIFVHGGQWKRNDKSQVELYQRVEKLTDAGFAIASINWTYSTTSVWPTQRDDVKTAMQFLQSNASKLGYSYDSVAIWGQSSGAHMAIWGGLLSADYGKPVDAIVSWYAPTDLYHIASDRAQQAGSKVSISDGEKAPESQLIGKNVLENKTEADEASPLYYVKNLPVGQKLPTFLLVHGTADHTVPMAQTTRLYEAIKHQKGSNFVDLVYIEGGEHGGEKFNDNVDYVVDFLKSQLQ